MKFSIKDFFSKSKQKHLLKKSLITKENNFCTIVAA